MATSSGLTEGFASLFGTPQQPGLSQDSTLSSGGDDLGKVSMNFDLAKHICTRLGGLWNSKKHTDVTLLVGVNRVPVHRVILASQSSYFDRLFFGDNVCEEQQKEINIDDVDNFNVFKLLLEYAYSGCMVIQDMNIQDVVEIIKLSDQFGFDYLNKRVVRKLMTIKDVPLLLACDVTYKIAGLPEKCYKFVDQNAEVLSHNAIMKVSGHILSLILSRDTLCVPEFTVFRTVVRWKESNKIDKEEMKDLLDCVRLTEIPPSLLMGEVLASSLFEDQKILQALQAQVQPNVELMRPRGIKCESGTNVMTRHTAVDPVLSISHSGKQALTNIVKVINIDRTITMNLPTVHVQPGQPPNPNRPLLQQQQLWSSVRVTLEQEYLVNTIELEGYPNQRQQSFTTADDSEVPVTGQRDSATKSYRQSFSYIIHVSKDGTNWIRLFNYSDYDCYKVQKLQFPTLAFKFFQFELTKASIQQFSLKLLKCSYEDSAPLHFRQDGIIAPLSPIKPKAHQIQESPNVLSVVFHQPYSVSTLSFTFKKHGLALGILNHKADIYVSSNNGNELGQVKQHPLNERLKVSFNEQVITFLKVEIKEMKSDAPVNQPPIPTNTGKVNFFTGLTTSLVQYKVSEITCQSTEN